MIVRTWINFGQGREEIVDDCPNLGQLQTGSGGNRCDLSEHRLTSDSGDKKSL